MTKSSSLVKSFAFFNPHFDSASALSFGEKTLGWNFQGVVASCECKSNLNCFLCISSIVLDEELGALLKLRKNASVNMLQIFQDSFCPSLDHVFI